MNDLVVVNNSLMFQVPIKSSRNVVTEDDIYFIERLTKVSYKDFPFEEWENKYIKLYVEGSFPLKVGNMMNYKKSKIIHKGFILGYDKVSNVLMFLSKAGNEMIYIPSIDGTLTLFEGLLRNKHKYNEMQIENDRKD